MDKSTQVDYSVGMDHTTLILRSEALCSEFPNTNITLQNVAPYALSEKYKTVSNFLHGQEIGQLRVRHFRNGSSITVAPLLF